MSEMRIIFWLFSVVVIFIFVLNIFILYNLFLNRSLIFLLFCSLIVMIRLFYGPTAADRIAAITIISIMIIGLCGILALFTGKNWYMDIALVWALQSFIAALTFAKFLERKKFYD
ncbi:MAG: multiple resistance and pH regulation protein F [Candidatus Omnitrophica bacterium]|nr:multiple resistance and pH regulation protein F [Candidatus Omnitrophota bacterium]